MLRVPISAHHCSKLTGIIPKYEQPFYINQYDNESKNDNC